MNRLSILFCILVLASCAAEIDVEREGAALLSASRHALDQGMYDAARDSIFSLRHRFPTAVKARRQGILLLDSIELFSSRDSVSMYDSGVLVDVTGEDRERLNVKMQFYERKLSEDLRR